MTKDIVREKYGRQYELATGLARAGWEVRGYCLDYGYGWKCEVIEAGGVEWHTCAAPTRFLRWRREVRRCVREWRPDGVMGCADPFHIAEARVASDEGGVGLAVDLHDNLESMGAIRVPGSRKGYEKALRRASLVTCVSEPLRDKISRDYSLGADLVVLENAVPELFEPGVKARAASNRRRYRLDIPGPVIGTAGALYRRRGIETVLSGFNLLREEFPGMVLALAGPIDKDRRGFDQEGIRYFGNLAWTEVPEFLSVLDIGIVPNIRPVFADYCYPQKAVEFRALSIPFVAAEMGVMKAMAKDDREILYRPDSAEDFARAVRHQLSNRFVPDVPVRDWNQQAELLDRSLRRML